jgi:catechol 2,3-dioxygenase-like lactoylglutathione lyase family enzyme
VTAEPGLKEMSMQPHVDVLTIGVADLERSLAFYRDGLGLETKGVIASEYHDDESGASGAVVMFHLAGGLILALYPRTDLAMDAGVVPQPAGPSAPLFSIGHLVSSRQEVDELLGRAVAAGVTTMSARAKGPGASTPATFAIRMGSTGK